MNPLQQEMYDRLWNQFLGCDYGLINTAKEFILKGMSEDDVSACVRLFSDKTLEYGTDDDRMREELMDFYDAVFYTGPASLRLFEYDGPLWKDS